jgi:hypothetical protein
MLTSCSLLYYLQLVILTHVCIIAMRADEGTNKFGSNPLSLFASDSEATSGNAWQSWTSSLNHHVAIKRCLSRIIKRTYARRPW